MPNVYVSHLNTQPSGRLVPALKGYVPPRYNISVGPWRGDGEFELTSISNRHLTVKLNDPSEFSFDVMGDAEVTRGKVSVNEASLVNELVDDVWVTRNGMKLARCRIMTSTDTLNATDYGVHFTALDYRELLRRRVLITSNNNLVLPSGIYSEQFASWPIGTPPEQVVWALIAHAESQPGMALGITQGEWEVTGIPPTAEVWRYADGDNIGWSIRNIALMDPGFDFWIDADKVAKLQKKRGYDRGVVLDYGGIINSVTRNFNSDSFANMVRMSGRQPSQPYTYPLSGSYEEQKLVDPYQTPEGGWATAIGDQSLLSPEQVQRAGKASYDRLSRLAPTYTAVFQKGAWGGPEHVWVGDTVRLVVKRGRLVVDDLMRVFQIDISIDQNEVETVSVVLNWPDNPEDNLHRFVHNVYYLNSV